MLFYLRFVEVAIVAQFLVMRLPLYAELDKVVFWGIDLAIDVLAVIKVRISLLVIGAMIAFCFLVNQWNARRSLNLGKLACLHRATRATLEVARCHCGYPSSTESSTRGDTPVNVSVSLGKK